MTKPSLTLNQDNYQPKPDSPSTTNKTTDDPSTQQKNEKTSANTKTKEPLLLDLENNQPAKDSQNTSHHPTINTHPNHTKEQPILNNTQLTIQSLHNPHLSLFKPNIHGNNVQSFPPPSILPTFHNDAGSIITDHYCYICEGLLPAKVSWDSFTSENRTESIRQNIMNHCNTHHKDFPIAQAKIHVQLDIEK